MAEEECGNRRKSPIEAEMSQALFIQCCLNMQCPTTAQEILVSLGAFPQQNTHKKIKSLNQKSFDILRSLSLTNMPEK